VHHVNASAQMALPAGEGEPVTVRAPAIDPHRCRCTRSAVATHVWCWEVAGKRAADSRHFEETSQRLSQAANLGSQRDAGSVNVKEKP
jgi:hypothetical protein